MTPSSDPPPESPVASQLLEAIRAKEPTEKLGEILDSLSSIDPDSEFLIILELELFNHFYCCIFSQKETGVSLNVGTILSMSGKVL